MFRTDFSREEILGQGRPVIGPVRLVADEDEPSGKPWARAARAAEMPAKDAPTIANVCMAAFLLPECNKLRMTQHRSVCETA